MVDNPGMLEVIFTCPKTGRDISTGIVVGSREVFAEMVLRDAAFECVECGDTHIVQRADTRLREAPGLDPSPGPG